MSTWYVQEWVGTLVAPSLTAQVGGAVTFWRVGGAEPGGESGGAGAGEPDGAGLRFDDHLAGAGEVLARVVADAPAQQAVRRHTQVFRVTG